MQATMILLLITSSMCLAESMGKVKPDSLKAPTLTLRQDESIEKITTMLEILVWQNEGHKDYLQALDNFKLNQFWVSFGGLLLFGFGSSEYGKAYTSKDERAAISMMAVGAALPIIHYMIAMPRYKDYRAEYDAVRKHLTITKGF